MEHLEDAGSLNQQQATGRGRAHQQNFGQIPRAIQIQKLVSTSCHGDSTTAWQFNIAIENGHLQSVFPVKVVIFHSYVSLPKGNCRLNLVCGPKISIVHISSLGFLGDLPTTITAPLRDLVAFWDVRGIQKLISPG